MKRGLMALALGLAADVRAGTISIVIAQRAELLDGRLTARVTVSNHGDEAAHAVTPALGFLGSEARGRGRDVLPPAGSFQEPLTLPLGGGGEGRWPFVLTVDYEDANHVPFQALLVALCESGRPPASPVVVREVRAGPLADEATLKVTVKNESRESRSVRLAVFVPRDFEAEPQGDRTLGAGEERPIPVALTNRRAPPGSRYPVFVAVEWEEGHVHQAALGQTMVEIVSPWTQVLARRRAFWIVALLLSVLWAVVLAVRMRRGRAPS